MLWLRFPRGLRVLVRFLVLLYLRSVRCERVVRVRKLSLPAPLHEEPRSVEPGQAAPQKNEWCHVIHVSR